LTSETDQDAPASLRGWRRVLTLVAVNLTLFLVVVEVGLRFLPLAALSDEELRPAYLDSPEARKTQPHPYLAYSLKPGWRTPPDKPRAQSINGLGFRGDEISVEKPPGVFRIACLGGSSTYGSTPSSNAATYPARLEERLRAARPDIDFQVINAGVPSWSTFESMSNLAFRLVDLELDLVIVYHSTNDMTQALYGEPRWDNTHWRAVWPIYKPSLLEPYLERSMTYLLWRKHCTNILETRADLGFNGIVDYDPSDTDPLAKGEISERGFLNFERNLTTMVGVARIHGARIIFGTQAMRDDLEEHRPRSAPAQYDAMRRMTTIIRTVAERHDVLVIDAEARLEAEAKRLLEETGKEQVFSGNVHLKDRGADLLAETFAAGILASDYLP